MADFKPIAFRTFDFERILINDSQDPDENFLNHFDKSSFSMLHLNIRSLQKNFDSLFNLLMTLKSEFKAICITEPWRSDNSMNHNLFKLPQYKNIHQVRRTG